MFKDLPEGQTNFNPKDEFIARAKDEFRKEYKKVYAGILPDEIINTGNSWFEKFLLKEISESWDKGTEQKLSR